MSGRQLDSKANSEYTSKEHVKEGNDLANVSPFIFLPSQPFELEIVKNMS